MSFREMIISFSLIGLFMLSFITFAVQMTDDNTANNTLRENELINSTFSKLQSNLSVFQSNAQGQRENYEAEDPASGFGTLIIFGIIGFAKVFTGMVVGVSNILFGAASSVLGIDPVVIGVFGSLLIATLIIYGWRLAKTGE